MAWGSEQQSPAESDLPETVREMVDQLRDIYRLPVLLHYYHELSTQETAVALGISHNAVRTRLSRAVTRLRDQLQQRGHMLALPVIIALLVPKNVMAAPPALSTSLQQLAATAPLPATGGLAGVMVSSAMVKLATAVGVVGIAVLGSVVLQLAPVPTRIAASTRPVVAKATAGVNPVRTPPVPISIISAHAIRSNLSEVLVPNKSLLPTHPACSPVLSHSHANRPVAGNDTGSITHAGHCR